MHLSIFKPSVLKGQVSQSWGDYYEIWAFLFYGSNGYDYIVNLWQIFCLCYLVENMLINKISTAVCPFGSAEASLKVVIFCSIVFSKNVC